MTDVTPLIPAGRQVIDSYGPTGFRVSGVAYDGAILVRPEQTLNWPVADFAALQPDNFAPLFGRGVEILLVGSGRRLTPLPPALRVALKGHGMVADVMDTGAACRTYNILLAEERRVAAALFPTG